MGGQAGLQQTGAGAGQQTEVLELGSKRELELGSKRELELGSKRELELGSKQVLELGSRRVGRRVEEVGSKACSKVLEAGKDCNRQSFSCNN